MAYQLDPSPLLSYFRDYIRSTLNAQEGVAAIATVPFTFSMLAYPWSKLVPPLTLVEVEAVPIERGPSANLSAAQYGFSLHLSVWRVVARTGSSIAEMAEVTNLATLGETIANDPRLMDFTGATADEYADDSEIHGLMVGDDTKAAVAIKMANAAASLAAVGLSLTVDYYSNQR